MGSGEHIEHIMPDTVEKKADVKNGIARLGIALISILIELALIILPFTRINEYVEWINVTTHLLAIILALIIYGQHKTSSMKIPWIVFILAFPIFGVAMYLIVGFNGFPKKMRRRFEEIDKVVFGRLPDNLEVLEELKKIDKDACGISFYLKNKMGFPVYKDSKITYFDDASRALEAQLNEISRAEHFVFMEYHAIEDKESWKRIQDELEQCVKRGVEVRVFYDDIGSIGFINTDFIKKLGQKGIACRVFNPCMPVFNMFMNNRDHRKITVIDGHTGFTGGYNLANEYFNITHPYGRWKDTGIMIKGPAVKSLTATFLEMWNALPFKDSEDKDIDRYLPDVEPAPGHGGFVQPYADTPLDDEQVGENVYISMIDKASSYCYFITPYLIITDEMIHAMGLAAKRGVDVRIITPGIPDKKIIYAATRSFYNSLVRNGVRIYEWTPGFCHAKMCLADDKMATCGTINLDYRSLYHHFENGCFFYDCDAVHDMKEDFEKTFAQCTEVTEQYALGRSASLRLWQLFLRLFAALM